MKVAVLSDVHGNVPALSAVMDDIEAWHPDEIVVNGDLVNRGPRSLECLNLLGQRFPRARGVRGNHENFVLRASDEPRDPDDPAYDLSRMAHWTHDQLGDDIDRIRDWEDGVSIEGKGAYLTHGSLRGDRDGILPDMSDEQLREKIGEGGGLFVGSHTHRPFVREVNGTLVVNTGSVGQPFDGDPRAAYARLRFEDGAWHAEIARVEFDRVQALRDFEESGFLEAGGPLAQVVFREVAECRILLGPWMRRYRRAVEAGEVTAEEAVEEYLGSL